MRPRRANSTAFFTVVVSLVVAGCQQPAPTNGTTTVFSIAQSLVHSDGDQLRDLIKAGKYRDAAEWYNQKADYFKTRTQDYQIDFDKIVEALNALYLPKFTKAVADLDRINSWPPPESDWPSAKEALSQAKGLIDEYGTLRIISDQNKRLDAADALAAKYAAAESSTNGGAFEALRKHGLFNPVNFFEIYPGSVESMQLSSPHQNDIEAMAKGHPFADFRIFASTYRDTKLPHDLLVAISDMAFSAAKIDAARAGLPANQALFSALKETLSAGYRPEVDSIKVIKATSQAAGDFAINFVGDAGIGVLDQNGANPDELVKSIHIDDGIFVFCADAHASSITTNIEDEQSTYLAGYQTQPNPDYPLAVLGVQKAQQDLAAIEESANANSNTTGNAALAAAAINTVAVIVAENNYNKAIQNLRNTPPTIQVPVSAAYTYKKATIQANKTAQVAVVFVDVPSHSYVAATIPVTDERQFTVLLNFRKDDNGSSYERADAVSQADVTAWEDSKIDFDLAKIPDMLSKSYPENRYDSIQRALSQTTVREAAATVSPGRPVTKNGRSSSGDGEEPETSQIKKVAMEQDGGTYVVSGLINNALTLKFVVDSGATDVAIPADVVSTLIRIGTLGKSDFIGSQVYKLADGSLVPSATFRIKSLKIGDIVLQNVTGSVSSASGDPLLGQSFLRRFKSWSIDNSSHSLVLQ